MVGEMSGQLSGVGHQRMPLLRTATREELDICQEYKSGASYKGQIVDHKKSGHGIFIWPSGARYEGEFCENARTGKGKQTFEDGTVYEGDFNNDLRHGQGKVVWPNVESYEGAFFKDRRHGAGIYGWPDGASYTGTFYIDRREGYGTLSYPDGSKFQGLYKGDERFGPGVHTHADGRQDVGLWHRELLVRLCSEVSDAFTMADHSEFKYNPEEQRTWIYPEYLQNRTDVIESILNPPEQFNYPPEVDIRAKSAEQIFRDALDTRSLAVDIRAFDEAFFSATKAQRKSKQAPKSASVASSRKGTVSSAKSRVSSASKQTSDKPTTASKTVRIVDSKTGLIVGPEKKQKSKPNSAVSNRSMRTNSAKSVVSIIENDAGEDLEEEAVLAWNRTPSCIAMQKHVIRHRATQNNVDFDVEKVCAGDRSDFGASGPMEQDSLALLEAAMTGHVNDVSDLLVQGRVHVDVADKGGHTALLGAAVNWHESVINCLLDNGANVNKLNDEGVSALAACHVYFYSADRFIYNIAEKDKDPPADFEHEPGYDVNEAVKGIYTTKKRPNSTENKLTHEQKLENAKITHLRKQYGGLSKSQGHPENTDNEGVDPGESILSKDHSRQLGTLKFKRAVRINVDDILGVSGSDPPIETDRDSFLLDNARYRSECESDASDDRSTDFGDEFASQSSVRGYRIDVSNELIERCATALSTNDMVVNRARSAANDPASLGTVRRLAIDKNMHVVMEGTILLLLRRGADPNASQVPMPVLFFAVKAGDVEAVKLLLLKGASTKAVLPAEKSCLAPLHIAVALPGEEGVRITELLLNSLADPDIRALPDESFLNKNLEEEWSKDPLSEESRAISGGRTPLHIACARDDSYRHACTVVHLLLDHHANPNLLCNGHSPMALAVASGNDLAIDELLAFLADPCLPLTHGVGSVLCVASSTEYEHRRTPDNRLKLIDKLVRAGADILAPIPIGPKRLTGTAVDYAYYMYNLDRRIAHMPYHALSHAERETYNNRRKLLAHIGDLLRVKAVERERLRMLEENQVGDHTRSPSPSFVYMGAGQELPRGMVKSPEVAGRAVMGEGQGATPTGLAECSKVSFNTKSRCVDEQDSRKPLFRYCYECGRSVGVRLSACTRCKEVFYCSKVCKVKAWNARHKDECIRIAGQSETAEMQRGDSPTPQTDAEKVRPTAVKDIIRAGQGSRKVGQTNQAITKVVAAKDASGKRLEYLGSVKVGDHLRLNGPMRGTLKIPTKFGKAKPGLIVDPLTGLIRTIDPATGKLILMDNYSFE